MRSLSKLSLCAALAFLGCACSPGRHSPAQEAVPEMPDTLRVATLYSPTSFFYFRDQRMGYDYELLSRIAADHDLPLDWLIAPSLPTAIEWLDSGLVDLIAYEVPITAQHLEHILPCGMENVTHQVLVQPTRGNAAPLVTDVTELIGRDVYVQSGSRYHERILNLDRELGGGINIHVMHTDTLVSEDLVEMVHDGKIPLTIVDSDIAKLNRTYFPDINLDVAISLDQRSAWGVATNRQWLADSINLWTQGETPRKVRAQLLRRYFELAKNEGSIHSINFDRGQMSPFDDLFRLHAAESPFDWRMLAAQAFVESRFDPTVVSWAGARGIMQIMPATARAFGASADELVDNDLSIRLASEILRKLDRSLASKIEDPEKRVDFVLAAYNAGLAHVLDAIELAKVTGLDHTTWNGNVENAILLKANPEYFNHPVVKYGYFRGRQTTEYVRNVRDIYNKAVKAIHK